MVEVVGELTLRERRLMFSISRKIAKTPLQLRFDSHVTDPVTSRG